MKSISRVRAKKNVGASITIGITASACMSVLLMAASALCIQNEYVNITSISIIAMLIQILSSFCGSVIAGWVTKGKRLAVCSATSGGYLLLLSATSIIAYDGLSGGFFLGIVWCVIGLVPALFLSLRMEKGNKGRRRKGWPR